VGADGKGRHFAYHSGLKARNSSLHFTKGMGGVNVAEGGRGALCSSKAGGGEKRKERADRSGTRGRDFH